MVPMVMAHHHPLERIHPARDQRIHHPHGIGPRIVQREAPAILQQHREPLPHIKKLDPQRKSFLLALIYHTSACGQGENGRQNPLFYRKNRVSHTLNTVIPPKISQKHTFFTIF